jgi:predicted Rossmann fold nucleotide-binding protein DprA/Smf involved in DNA uptake
MEDPPQTSPESSLFTPANDASRPRATGPTPPTSGGTPGLSPLHQRILHALSNPSTADTLAQTLDLAPHELRAQITVLEVLGQVRRRGSLLERARERQ